MVMHCIVAGSYERVLFGFELRKKQGRNDNTTTDSERNDSNSGNNEKEDQMTNEHSTEAAILTHELHPKFLLAAHDGCIKVLASSSSSSNKDEILEPCYVVSGSTDESLKLFDIGKNLELGSLSRHRGPISCLSFHSNSHLISASEDGSIIIWDSNNWEPLYELSGHKTGIVSIAIHPSGKLMLSLAKDRTLKMWNLIKGKCAFTQRLEREGDIVIWSPSASWYAISGGNTIDIFQALNAEKKVSFQHSHRILAAIFLKEDVIAAGGEDRNITLWNLSTSNREKILKGHKNRIKGLAIVPNEENKLDRATPTSESSSRTFFPLLVSISSDGFIKVWNPNLVHENSKDDEGLVAQISTSARLTCLTVASIATGLPSTIKERKEEKPSSEIVSNSLKSEKMI